MEQGRNSEDKLKQQQDQQQPPMRRMKLAESHMAAAQNNHHHHHHQQPPPPQKCPRCDSSNTKFCYYNNYSLSQPRYFCKACRRYWTHGGTLRNVPVGGGCRKSKRPKPSISSSSNSEIARTHHHHSSSPALPSHNLTGLISGQALRAFPPVMPSMGNSFYTGGAFLSSLAAMQSLPPGISQGAASTVNFGGGGNAQYGANMAFLQGINLPSLKPQAPSHFQAQSEFFSSQQSLTNFPPRPLGSWTQSFIMRGAPASSSAACPASFWSGATADGSDNQAAASSSFNPSHWSDNNPGFDPSQ